jgi:hypothetical protein
MSRSMRASILQVAMLLIAAPVIAWADPGPVATTDPNRSPRVYADNDSVDCSKLDDDDAREKCREKKVERRTDDANVDCSKLDSDEAREKCREKKVDRRSDDGNVDCSQIKDDSARRRCMRAKVKN